jgi:hypothetical protein
VTTAVTEAQLPPIPSALAASSSELSPATTTTYDLIAYHAPRWR